MSNLYTTSPKTKQKIDIGTADIFTQIATFYITENRFFRELPGFGLDAKIFPKKDLAFCRYYHFKLWDGREYWIEAEVFRQHSWKYPKTESMEYKATPLNFAQKMVLTMENWEELKLNEEKLEEIKAKMFQREVGC